MTGDIKRGIIVLTREEVLQLIEEVVEKYQNGNQAGEAQAATSANQPAGKNVEAETAEDNGEETAAPGGDTSTPESDADTEADNVAEPREDSAAGQQEESSEDTADGKDAAPGGDNETGSDLENAFKKIHKLNRENQTPAACQRLRTEDTAVRNPQKSRCSC